MTGERALEIAPVGMTGWLFLMLIGLIGPITIGLVFLTSPSAQHDALALGLVALLSLVIVILLLLAARRRAVALDGAVLDVRATFYRRRIPLAEIDLGRARVIDLRERPELRPWLKTNGFAMPGLAAGNFRDRQKNRLFCLVTAPRVLSLPLHDGCWVLVSFERPAAALEHLRRVAVDA